MSKIMLIDAAHPEEVRVAVLDDNRLEEYDVETASKKQTKGNIYLAKVIRIEPSLQAAFVQYGAGRHGFLPFAEIHPDYYQIPIADREKMLAEVQAEQPDDDSFDGDDEDATPRRPHYRYRIQEVIKRRQILLIQVVKEERGTKGAALTTYLTLAGRYCVLMPNSGRRSGGISRKISIPEDRKRLKEILNSLDIPEQMSVIVRTAGQARTKAEIKRDYDYLLRTWEEVRDLTLKSIAPAVVYSEGDLLKRAIRDIYHRDIDKILVEGEEACRLAKGFMRNLMPSHSKRIQQYRGKVHLFQSYGIEDQISGMFQSKVTLPSGGSIVINSTEALVAVDVNSGRSTRERHIDETALKTNLEAAEEVARQMRLRDLAGLIVVDFIDMHEKKYTHQVEKRFRDAIKNDRARIQVGRISEFGLLELSRQRLRPSLLESNTTTCSHCQGTGFVRSVESSALVILRAIETEGFKEKSAEILVSVPSGVDLYLLNQKRRMLMDIETQCNFSIIIQRDESLVAPDFRLQSLAEHKAQEPESTEETQEVAMPKEKFTPLNPQKKKHHPQRPREQKIPDAIVESVAAAPAPVAKPAASEETPSSPHKKRRRRYHKRRRLRDQPNRTEGPDNVIPFTENSPAEPRTEEQKKTRKGWWQRLLES